MSKRMKTHLLLHPNHASPLLNEKAIALLPEIRLEVGLQRIVFTPVESSIRRTSFVSCLSCSKDLVRPALWK